MAFDKNNTTTGMKVIIVIFCVILVVSLCLPFFSSCSQPQATTGDQEAASEQASEQVQAQTAAQIEALYSPMIDDAQQRLSANPNDYAALAALGNNNMSLGNALMGASDAATVTDRSNQAFSDAIGYYDRCLEINPNDSIVKVYKATCLSKLGQRDEAVAALQEVVEADETCSPAWYGLAEIYTEEADYDAALEALQKAMELDPNDMYGIQGDVQYLQFYIQIMQQSMEAAAADATEGGEADAHDHDHDHDAEAATGTDAVADDTDAVADGTDAATDGASESHDHDAEAAGASGAETSAGSGTATDAQATATGTEATAGAQDAATDQATTGDDAAVSGTATASETSGSTSGTAAGVTGSGESAQAAASEAGQTSTSTASDAGTSSSAGTTPAP